MSVEEPSSEPCPRCGEPAPLAGRLCPHCGGSLLVDLLLEQPVRDSRTRYQLARSMSRLGQASFLELQKTLACPGAPVLSGVTRKAARQAQEMLRQSGTSARFAPHVSRKRQVKIPLLVAGSLVLVALAASVAWLLLSSGREKTGLDTVVVQPSEELSTQQIAERVTPSIVVLTCRQSVGSGFFVTSEQLLTNAHVLCSGNEGPQVHFSDGSKITGEVVDVDEELDLALVEVPGASAEALCVGDAAGLSAGERVVFIGTPLGMSYTVHEGIVSHAARNLFGTAYIQVDGNINPGNSGGPLIDRRGKVVGIISMKIQNASGLGFALPINYAYGKGLVDGSDLDPAPWADVLRQIEEEDQRAITEAEQAFVEPGVTQAFVERGNVLLVIVLRRSPFPPRPGEEIPFSIMRDRMTVCSGTMPVSSWAPFDVTLRSAPEGTSDQPQFKWLAKNGLIQDLYWGGAYFGEESCGDRDSLVGAEFVLEGGDPNYDRTTIVSR